MNKEVAKGLKKLFTQNNNRKSDKSRRIKKKGGSNMAWGLSFDVAVLLSSLFGFGEGITVLENEGL